MVFQPPPPIGPQAALYLTVTEFADGGALRLRHCRALMRSCSILVQRDPKVKKFSNYHLRQARSQELKFYHTKDPPESRDGEPGLLSIDFVA